MALLDVTQILTDPDLTDRFSVRRRAESVDSTGFAVETEEFIPNLIGVIVSISPSDLDRQADYQTMSRSITVVSKFALRGEVTGFQPDLVVWRGNNYLVKHIDPYPQFGPGFFQAECSSVDKTDAILESGFVPQLSFNSAANAAYLFVW
jgi:hypothetical protein